MEGFVKLGNVGGIQPGTGRLFRHNGIFIAVFNSWGSYFAVEGHCTCCGASLAECEFTGTLIACPSDATEFYLPAGTYMGTGGLRPLISFRVRIDKDAAIEVKLVEPEEIDDDLNSTEQALYGYGQPISHA